MTFCHNAIYMANPQNILIGFPHFTPDNIGEYMEVSEVLRIPIELGRSKVHGLFAD